jgi:hypothetical protein
VTNPWWNPRVPAWLAAVVISLAIVTPIGAQLEQSGGNGSNASVGSTGATAPTSATLAGGAYNSSLPTLSNGQMGALQVDSSARTIVVGAGTAGTPAGGIMSVQGVSGGQAVPVSGTFWQTTQPVSGTVRTVPLNACGTTVASQALGAVPTSSTAVFSSTTCVQYIVMNNTTSGALTVTVTDNQGTPVNDILTFSIPGYSQLIQPLGGVAFTSGVKWSASGSGVTGAILGNQ